jgi:hypothetical protein
MERDSSGAGLTTKWRVMIPSFHNCVIIVAWGIGDRISSTQGTPRLHIETEIKEG